MYNQKAPPLCVRVFVFLTHHTNTLRVPRGVFCFVFLQTCLPFGQIAASALSHVLVLYCMSTTHVSHVNSATPCRQLPPNSANASLAQLYVRKIKQVGQMWEENIVEKCVVVFLQHKTYLLVGVQSEG